MSKNQLLSDLMNCNFPKCKHFAVNGHCIPCFMVLTFVLLFRGSQVPLDAPHDPPALPFGIGKAFIFIFILPRWKSRLSSLKSP